MRLPSLVAVFATAVIFSACQSEKIDNSVIVDPGTAISFSAEVLPILTASCGGFGCHVMESTNGVNVTTYTQLIGSNGLQYGGPVVIPGNAAGSPLVDKISPSPTHGARMPLGAATLSASEIALIQTWIDEGAEDN